MNFLRFVLSSSWVCDCLLSVVWPMQSDFSHWNKGKQKNFTRYFEMNFFISYWLKKCERKISLHENQKTVMLRLIKMKNSFNKKLVSNVSKGGTGRLLNFRIAEVPRSTEVCPFPPWMWVRRKIRDDIEKILHLSKKSEST